MRDAFRVLVPANPMHDMGVRGHRASSFPERGGGIIGRVGSGAGEPPTGKGATHYRFKGGRVPSWHGGLGGSVGEENEAEMRRRPRRATDTHRITEGREVTQLGR